MKRIVRLDGTQLGANYTPENIVSGRPTATLNNVYTDPSNRFNCGVWSSTQGKWSFVQADSEEFCYIIEGKARLVGKDGSSDTVCAGDAFIIPIGFEGTWETIEGPLRKFYAAYENKTNNIVTSKL